MKGGSGRRDFEIFVVLKSSMGGLNFFQGGFFGFVGDGEASEVGERGEVGFLAVFGEIFGKTRKIGFQSSLEDGVIGLIGLDNNRGGVEVAATDATDDLGEKLESAFFGGEIRESEAGIGLDDADGGEMGEIETAGEGLGADEDIDDAGFNVVVEGGEILGFLVIAVKPGDFGLWEESRELGFEKLGTKAFVNNAGVVTLWTACRDFFGVATEVTAQSIIIGVEGQGKVAIRAEGLPAAVLADGHRGRTTSIMKNKSLMFILNIVCYFCQEKVGKVAIFGEIGAVFEIDKRDFGVDGGLFGFFGELDEGMMSFSEVIVDEIRGGRAEDAFGLWL